MSRERYNYRLVGSEIKKRFSERLERGEHIFVWEEKSEEIFGKSIERAMNGLCVIEKGTDPKDVTPTIPRHLGLMGYSSRVGTRSGNKYVEIWLPQKISHIPIIPAERKPEKIQKTVSVQTLIDQGEGQQLEFKSTLRVDLHDKGMKCKDVEDQVAKAICGFLNRPKGGQLLIGVQDDGKILGLKSDYTSLSQKTRRGGRDAFERQLRQVVSSHLGKLFNQHVDIHFVEVQGKDVCLVDISHAYKAAWIKEKGHVIFYVRSGNQTVPLDPQEAVEYISHTWRSP